MNRQRSYCAQYFYSNLVVVGLPVNPVTYPEGKRRKKKIKMKKDTTNKETIFNKENFADSLIKEYKTARKRKITALKGSVQSEREKMEKCSALVLRYKPDSIQRAPIQNKNYIINT
ncbi:unnamed protein product [Moneuplotes crassus]|uniref:Uncharacterized protein n=1 Tax=Euplotes crassus TaxID=5936 RepID=A0AAD2D3A3_EUPCR|nr:unnamed protein product [Moneuplotes crassus]